MLEEVLEVLRAQRAVQTGNLAQAELHDTTSKVAAEGGGARGRSLTSREVTSVRDPSSERCIEQLKQRCQELEEQVRELNSRTTCSEAAADERERELKGREKEILQLEEEKKALESQIEKAKAQSSESSRALEEQAKDLARDLEKANAQLEEARAQLEQLPLLKQSLQATEAELQKEKASAAQCNPEMVEELRASERRLQDEVHSLQSKALDREAEVSALQSKALSREAEVSALQNEALDRERKLVDRLTSSDEEQRALRSSVEKLKAAAEEAKSGSRDSEERASRMTARLQELERTEQELRAENRSLAEDRAKLTAQREEQERYLNGRYHHALDTARRLDEEKRTAQAELQGLRAEVARSRRSSTEASRNHEETQELRNRCARLEDQLRREAEKVNQLQHQQLQHPQQHQQLQQQVGLSQEQQAMLQRAVQIDRDSKVLQRAFEDQKKEIERMEHMVKECSNMSNLCTNGELRRMIKAYEDENLASTNSALKTALGEAESKLYDSKQTIAERDDDIKELKKTMRRGGM